MEAVRSGDEAARSEIVKNLVRDDEYTVIKCRGCGDIVAFEKTAELIALASDANAYPAFKYLVLKHMADCPAHNVVVPMMGVELPFSRMLDANLREGCRRGGVDYDSWLPSFVERWRLKCGA